MRFLIIFYIPLLLTIPTIKSFANENKAIQATYDNAYPNFIISSSPINQQLLTKEVTAALFNGTRTLEFTSQLKGEFTTRLVSLKVGIVKPKQEANWSKYYLKGSVILHEYNDLNVSLMANLEQTNNFYHHLQASQLNNATTSNETEANYSYGIVGSYDINPAWQFSGGIIHAAPLNESIQNTWYGDTNMALLGTSYSF